MLGAGWSLAPLQPLTPKVRENNAAFKLEIKQNIFTFISFAIIFDFIVSQWPQKLTVFFLNIAPTSLKSHLIAQLTNS